MDSTRLKSSHVPWIALAIATVGTSARLTIESGESVTAERTCTFVPQRLSVERLSPHKPSVRRHEIDRDLLSKDQKIQDDLVRLFDDLERNETLKRLVRGAMEADRPQRRPR